MFISRRPRRRSGFSMPALSNLFKGKWTKQRLLTYAGFGALGVLLFGFIMAFVLFSWYARDLPSPGKLSQHSEFSTVLKDRNNKVIYEMYKDKNRVPVKGTDISKYLKQATVAVEDKDFYKHGGISESGIIRAAFSIVFKGDVQGGSTLTQQLIKNVLLTSERSLPRKIKEAILASEVEKRYSKDEILEMYLNEVPYGGSYYGVGAASKGYFGKEPKNLDLTESAILAGLPQNPSNYSPFFGRKDAWKARAKDVLRRMRQDGYITAKQEKDTATKVDKYKFTSPKEDILAPHFVFFVRKFVEQQLGASALQQGLQIKTTLDLEAQKVAQDVVKEEVEELKDDYDLGNAAAVVLDSKNGDILAMVGSYDYDNDEYGKFDVATQGLRQPGSSLKPIIYALAFEKKYTASDVLMDVKTDFGQGYTPVNYDGKFRGPVQMRMALGNSLNVPAVKTLALVGVKDFLQKASDMGLETLAPTEENMNRFGLSIALGGGEVTLLDLTSAYSVFADGGTKHPVQFIEEIRDYKGKVIYRKPQLKEKKVLSREVAFLVSHILSDDNARAEAFGTGSLLNIPGKTVAVKTGTTDEKRDNWAVGFTNDITVGVWAGNNDNSKLNEKVASGTTGASSIWHKVMAEMLKKYKDDIVEKPDTVNAMVIDAYLGGLPRDGQPTRSEYFIKGTEPTEQSKMYKKLKVRDGKLANDIQIRGGSFEEKDYIVFQEDDPISIDGKNYWQEGIQNWLKDQTDDKLKPPTETSSDSAEDVVVNVSSPSNRSTVDTNDVKVSGKVTSGAKIKSIKIYFNGELKKTIDGDNTKFEETINMPDGAYELKVVAKNEKDKEGNSTSNIGVKKPWDDKGTAPTAAPAPSNTPAPSP